jgi:hypothetical protein
MGRHAAVYDRLLTDSGDDLADLSAIAVHRAVTVGGRSGRR